MAPIVHTVKLTFEFVFVIVAAIMFVVLLYRPSSLSVDIRDSLSIESYAFEVDEVDYKGLAFDFWYDNIFEV